MTQPFRSQRNSGLDPREEALRPLPSLTDTRLRWLDQETGGHLSVTARVSRSFLEDLESLGFQDAQPGLEALREESPDGSVRASDVTSSGNSEIP